MRGLLHKGAEALRVAQGVALSPFFLRRGDLTRLQGEDDSVVGLALRILLLERLQLLGEVDAVDRAALELHDLCGHVLGGSARLQTQQLANRLVRHDVLGRLLLRFLEAAVLGEANLERLHDLLLRGVLAQTEQFRQLLDVHRMLSSFKIV